MKAPKFERHKIDRLIKVHGEYYYFYRDTLDEFKEPTGGTSYVSVRGVFHETVSPIIVTTSESAAVQDKPNCYILTLYDEKSQQIQQGDFTYINDRKYTVTGVTNTGNWNIALDINLEPEV